MTVHLLMNPQDFNYFLLLFFKAIAHFPSYLHARRFCLKVVFKIPFPARPSGNPSANNHQRHLVREEETVKANIPLYLGDLGIEESCWLGKFCFNNFHNCPWCFFWGENTRQGEMSLYQGQNSKCNSVISCCLLSPVHTRPWGWLRHQVAWDSVAAHLSFSESPSKVTCIMSQF